MRIRLQCRALFGLFPCFTLLLWAAWRPAREEAARPFPTLKANPWNQADQLFRTDARWLGGDVAYTVDLGGGRVLWLFGDSFIASQPAAKRSESRMVRNSVAIQNGYDPSKASLKFYWKTLKKKPATFFSEKGGGVGWLWPTHGVRLGDKLLLFSTRVRSDSRKDSLGFENFGWVAFLVDNPHEEPTAWVLHRLDVPHNLWHIIVGAAALVSDDFLYVFGPAEPRHEVYLLRWPVSAAADGELSSPEWWCGVARGWVGQEKLTQHTTHVFSNGSMEFSVHRDRQHNKFLEVQSLGFGASDVAIRWADRPEGPWSEPQRVYHPPESSRPEVFVYAAKAHPELNGADVVVTYVANSNDKILATDMSIYYPRFVQITFPSR